VSTADPRRRLPAVHEVLQEVDARWPHALQLAETRAVLDEARERIASGKTPDSAEIAKLVDARLERLAAPSLRNLINATGVVLHTNLGRAPLAMWQPVAGYSNLEYDLAAGKRGKRDAHIQPLLERLLGASAIAVNNGAAALFLALHELAPGSEVIVSRGELIEIGDSFRIPEIMEHAGVILREVGTTNRARVEDYQAAITGRTKLLLRVHPSNFHITGFTARPTIPELAALSRTTSVPLMEDLGSGCIRDLRDAGVDEPLVAHSLRDGVDLVSFSGDKLLGGPQTGIIAGRRDLVERIRRNPVYRALRLDKTMCQILETTLHHLVFEQWDEIPALRMIRLSTDEIRMRAEALALLIPGAMVKPGESVIGGGSTPDQSLPTWLITVPCVNAARTETALRRGDPPVIVRVAGNQILLDLRTVFPAEEPVLVKALDQARSW
jgi:L-seryl-tRNA(Ser) seleniumtransferase